MCVSGLQRDMGHYIVFLRETLEQLDHLLKGDIFKALHAALSCVQHPVSDSTQCLMACCIKKGNFYG